MFYTYVLYSAKLNKKYIGSTKDLQKRIIHHNLGLDRWSKRGVPWIFLYGESFDTRGEAQRREYFFKTGKGREYIAAKVRQQA